METNEYGKTVQTARLKKGLSQFALSKRIGCTESFVSRIETGRTLPVEELQERIAHELQLALCEV